MQLRGQITPATKLVRYEIDMTRVIRRSLHMGIGDGIVLADGNPIYTAKDLKVDLVALVSRGASPVVQSLFGSTTEKLIHHPPAPLLIVPTWDDVPRSPQVRKIIVPLDGSRVAEMILPLAQRVAEDQAAEIVLTHVWTGPKKSGPAFVEMESDLNRLKKELNRNGCRARVDILHGDVVEGLIEAAEVEKADLYMLGAHGQGGLKRLFVGSVASRLLRRIDLPVVVSGFEALAKIGARPAGAAARER